MKIYETNEEREAEEELARRLREAPKRVKSDHSSKAALGAFFGLCGSSALCIYFILPNHVLDISLAALTVGDVLRILISILLVPTATWIGAIIGSAGDD